MGAGGSVLEHDSKSGGGNATPTKGGVEPGESTMFLVSFVPPVNGAMCSQLSVLPSQFYLRLGKESVDFVDKDSKLALLNFPYQWILCWGSTATTFKFTVEARSEAPGSETAGLRFQQQKIMVQTGQGKTIEVVIMRTVRALMADMESSMVTQEDFSTLKGLLVVNGKLEEDWFSLLTSFTTTRSLIAKQAMEIVQIIGDDSPFEKVDLACFLYTKMINKDSFQLVINCFDDPVERDNIIHRLKLNKKEQIATSTSLNGHISATL